jgi:hypothetical protein
VASCRLGAQLSGVFPEIGRIRGQSLFENGAQFRLWRSAMLCGACFQSPNDLLGHIANGDLGQTGLLRSFYAMKGVGAGSN